VRSPAASFLTPRTARSALGGGLELATELAVELAAVEGVDALHLFPLGGEASIREIAVAYRTASGVPTQRP